MHDSTHDTADAGNTADASAKETRHLDDLSQRLTQALQILDLEVDYPLLLGLAAETSRAVGPDGGPISTFLVGYAAGMTSTSGKRAASDAVERAVGVATQATRKTGDGGLEDGWANTAQ